MQQTNTHLIVIYRYHYIVEMKEEKAFIHYEHANCLFASTSID